MVKKGEKTEQILANEALKENPSIKKPISIPESMSVVATPKGLNASPGIVSQLENRRVLESQEIKTSVYASGRVAVSVCVNTEGVVTSAKFKASGSSTLDADLISIAVQNAQKFKFTNGTKEDCGVITYDFNL
ncbi:MAG: energy transducer TonB [Saprospiraceae bacterium]|nr:energy transducer TonB [Saprospiraceae bacterium]